MEFLGQGDGYEARLGFTIDDLRLEICLLKQSKNRQSKIKNLTWDGPPNPYRQTGQFS
jgi:hypothetical protein